jgi:parallel beta-helix repeat protein
MPRARIRAAWIALAIALAPPVAAVHAAVYYVDNASSSCSSSGPGSESQPYCTIAAAVAAHHGPGVTIVVKPGLYREQVTLSFPGASGDPFVLQAQGHVVIDGADDVSSPSQWQPYVGDVFVASSVTWAPLQVFMNGVRLKSSTMAPLFLPDSSFRWISGEGLYVNLGGPDPGQAELLVGRRSYGVNLSTRTWIKIEGFTIVHAESRGIYLNGGCSDIVVSRDTVSDANSYGIQAVGGQRIVVEACRSSSNNLHGIGLTAGATGCTLRFNESFSNADPVTRRANGIHLYGAPGNTVQGNRLHDNQDSGLHFGDGSNHCLSTNNRSWNNGDHGYDHLNASGTTHLHDVAVGNYKDGFSIEDNSPNSLLANCIAIDNGLTTNEFDLWVNAPSAIGFVSDYNVFWNSTAQAPFKYIATVHASLAAYQAASGQDAHSLQADPLFVNASQGDFHPGPGSPAIDAASSAVEGWPPLDADGKARVNDPATVDSGVGPVPFADRGALEYLTNQAPVVMVPDAVTVAENDSISVAVTAVDPDGDPIQSLTAANLPTGASFVAGDGGTSGTLRWTPGTGQAGTYTVTFLASGAFTGSDSTVITVTNATTGVPMGGPPRGPRVAPNPMRSEARLQFTSPREGPLTVQVFDLSGRVVRTLLDRPDARAGDYDLPVGAGSAGEAPLRPGLYFYRIQAPDDVIGGRFVVLR